MAKLTISLKGKHILTIDTISKCYACEKFKAKSELTNLRDYIDYPIGHVWLKSKAQYIKIDAPLTRNDIYLCPTCLKLTRKTRKNLDFNDSGKSPRLA